MKQTYYRKAKSEKRKAKSEKRKAKNKKDLDFDEMNVCSLHELFDVKHSLSNSHSLTHTLTHSCTQILNSKNMKHTYYRKAKNEKRKAKNEKRKTKTILTLTK